MVRVCAWCEKYLGSMEPLRDPGVSHGICDDCVGRPALDEAPVLVVSRERRHAIPALQALLRGAPEIQLVVERRSSERRRGNGSGRARDLEAVADRREADRRRSPSFYLV